MSYCNLEMKTTKKMITVLLIILTLTVATPVACYMIVKHSTRERIYNDIDKIPTNRVGLLLGTSPWVKSGKKNYYFTHRINACVRLYKANKISKILVSGDNHTKEYDEPKYMKEALMARGVPEKDIVLDYAGFRTLDSIVRAKKVFGQTCFTIISQQFHNERAVYLAHANGIDAIAYNATQINKSKAYLKTGFIRESLARVKMFIDIFTGKQPKFLGEKIEI